MKPKLEYSDILNIAMGKPFCVYPNWSADGIRKKCIRLVHIGLLRYDGNWRRYGAYGDYFLPTGETKQFLASGKRLRSGKKGKLEIEEGE